MRLIREEIERPFDFAERPALRMLLLRLKEDEHILCVVLHHQICDGVSLEIFNHELTLLYEAFSKGMPSPLDELPIQYTDFARWQREWLQSPAVVRMISFWDRHLKGVGLIPELELPFAGPRPAVTSFRGAAETLGLSSHYVNR